MAQIELTYIATTRTQEVIFRFLLKCNTFEFEM